MNATPLARVHADTAVDHASQLSRLLNPGPRFELSGPDDAERAQVEACVAEKFRGAWNARVTQFLPQLLSMHCLGSCSAVAGLRPAGSAPLFLERYLDQPVEQVLAAAAGVTVSRRQLVEIGNLVASQRGASHLLFLILAAALHRAGYRWLVFTATHALRNNLHKLGLPLLALGPASPERLAPEARSEWGDYYRSEPWVMAGNLDAAMALIAERPLLRRVARLYRHQLTYLAAALRGN
jgi:hypothetical protein